MFIKIYEALWAVVLLAAIITYLIGSFTTLVAVIFGFISIGLIFMGMLMVLPSTFSHHSSDH